MKVIDLLNKIAKGETPKKIKYQNYKWVWTGDDYKTIKGVKDCFLITGQEYTWVTEFLNDEVEIIEENPKHIEEIKTIFVPMKNNDREKNIENITKTLEKYGDCINDLTKAVNYLLDKDE